MLISLIWNRLFVLSPIATSSKMKIKFDENLILESQNGIPYAIPQRLSTKKQVYTQAILQKIYTIHAQNSRKSSEKYFE